MKNIINYSTIQAELIIDELYKQNIHHFFISPGKRNIPLITALASKSIKPIITIDERNAAFQALGFAKLTKTPTVLICTSGSALSHYMPAILEALNTSTPLLIISADRPKELVHTHANQSISQDNFFHLPPKHYYYLPPFGDTSSPYFIKRLIAHITHLLTKRHIIHINCAFKEPLDKSSQKIPSKLKSVVKNLLQTEVPYTTYHSTSFVIQSLKHTAIVVGEGHSKTIPKIFLNTFFFADITTGQYSHLSNFHPDAPSFERNIKEQKIKHILHFGGRITSNKYYKLLQQFQLPVINITENASRLIDPSFSQIAVYPTYKLHSNLKFKNIISKKPLLDLSAPPPLSGVSISSFLWETIPSSDILVIGNSLAIRNFDIIPKNKRHRHIITQRGVSGIDGNIALAIGIARTTKSRVHLILGDIAALHNMNAIYDITDDLRLSIYILNNQSSGIFDRLQLKNISATNKLINTHHRHSFKLSPTLTPIYRKITNISDFISNYSAYNNSQGPLLWECVINPHIDQEIYNHTLQQWQ